MRLERFVHRPVRPHGEARQVLEVTLIEPDADCTVAGRSATVLWSGRAPCGNGRVEVPLTGLAADAPVGSSTRTARRSRYRPRRDASCDRRRAGLDGVDDLALPLRPGVVEHAGRVHRDVGRAARDRRSSSGRPSSRPDSPSSTRTSRPPGATPTTSSCSPRSTTSSRTGTRVPEQRALPAPAARRGPPRDHGRHLQRAEHQPDHDRDDDPQLRARHRLPARRPRRRPAHRLAARRLRPRPAVPRPRGRRRADVVVLGARPVPPVGADAVAAAPRGRLGRPVGDAVPGRVRVDLAVGQGRADALHAGALLGRLADRLAADAGEARDRGRTTCSCCSSGWPPPATCCCRSAPTTRRRASGSTEIHRDWNARYVWPRFECAIPRDFFAAVAAELDAPGRRPAPQTRDMNPVYTGKDVSYIDTKQAQRAAESLLVDAEMFAAIASLHGARLPARGAGQGVAAAGVRCAPRRDHRLRVGPGLPRPAHRLARGPRPRRGTCCAPRSTTLPPGFRVRTTRRCR